MVKLSFHMPDKHHVVYNSEDPIGIFLNHKSVDQSMFLAWMIANTIYNEGKDLT